MNSQKKQLYPVNNPRTSWLYGEVTGEWNGRTMVDLLSPNPKEAYYNGGMKELKDRTLNYKTPILVTDSFKIVLTGETTKEGDIKNPTCELLFLQATNNDEDVADVVAAVRLTDKQFYAFKADLESKAKGLLKGELNHEPA